MKNPKNSFFMPSQRDRGMNWMAAKKKYPGLQASRDWDNDGVKNSKDCRPLDPTRHGIIDYIKNILPAKTEREKETKRNYAIARDMGRRELIRRTITGPIVQSALKKPSQIRRFLYEHPRHIEQRKVAPYTKVQANVARKLVALPFPQLPKQAVASPDTIEGKQTGKVGRPRYSFKAEYAAYGGVMNYRKAMAAARKQRNIQERMSQLQQRMSNPQQAYQQAVREVEMQQQDYPVQEVPIRQVPVPQEVQYQYVQQTNLPQKRPIGTVFKSSGGHPYPPVDSQPLAPSNADREYIETTDAFTGRRFLKEKPRTESWIRPKEY